MQIHSEAAYKEFKTSYGAFILKKATLELNESGNLSVDLIHHCDICNITIELNRLTAENRLLKLKEHVTVCLQLMQSCQAYLIHRLHRHLLRILAKYQRRYHLTHTRLRSCYLFELQIFQLT